MTQQEIKDAIRENLVVDLNYRKDKTGQQVSIVRHAVRIYSDEIGCEIIIDSLGNSRANRDLAMTLFELVLEEWLIKHK